MIDFISANAGVIGLILFFVFFLAVTFWTLRPSARKQYKEYGNIPLQETEE